MIPTYLAAAICAIFIAQPPQPEKPAEDKAAAQKAAAEKAKATQKAAKEAAEKLKARQTRPSSEALSRRLVDAADVRASEVVLIRGHSNDAEQLEDIAVEVRRRGAFPVLRISSDRLEQKLYDETSPALDGQVDPTDAQLASTVNAIISIDADHSPRNLNHVPASRIAARARVQATLDQLMYQRGVRRVSLGRELYPTAATANRYALNVEELERAFWYACSADVAALDAMGDAVASQLSAGTQVVITGPNGTDLKFRIEKRRVFINDGTVAPEGVGAVGGVGGIRATAFVPAGEAYISVVPGTAEGKVVCDTLSYRGHEVQNLTINFKAGRITSFNGRYADLMRSLYDASGKRGDLGWLDIGLNPDIAIPRGVKPLCPTPAGMVSIGIGNNLWAGGENADPFSLTLYLPGTTVKVDNAPLVKDGVLAPTPVIPLLMTP